MKKKKILFILPWLPYPLVSGGHQAIFHGILAVKDDFDIYITYQSSYISPHPEDRDGFLEQIPNAILLPYLSEGNKLLNGLRFERWIQVIKVGIKRLLPKKMLQRGSNEDSNYSICSSWITAFFPPSKTWANFIESICSQYKFDIIQVEMPRMIPQVLCLPEKSFKIHVHHELGFVRRRLEMREFGKTDSYMESCLKFADTNEIGQLNKYDMVMTLSPVDKLKLKDMGVSVPIRESFAMVDTDEEYSFNNRCNNVLSFVGSDSHSPNYGAIIWFLECCWPVLKKEKPEYKLLIIGKWDIGHINEIEQKYKDVAFLGFVDDLKEALSGSIMIVPIQVGSGIRMKILEACSMAIPFVSTTIGAEGIPVIDGEHCFIADDSDMFVSKIIQLNEDFLLQKYFTFNAYKMVKDVYSMESLRSNRLGIYKELLTKNIGKQ